VGSLLAGLLLWGCSTEDGPEYDIPAGQRILFAQLETDADGTPLILAEVGMYYGTHDKREEWEPEINLSNAQSILFSKRGGTWSPHPFRNLQNGYSVQSMLARNASGSVQPLIWDRRKLTLFGRAGDGWIPRSIVRLDDDTRYYSVNSVSRDAPSLALVGDSAWHSVSYSYGDNRIQVDRSDGTSFALDSGAWFRPMAYYSGRDFNMAVGTRSNNRHPESLPALVSYRWSLDPAHPDPKAQFLSDVPGIYSGFFATSEGEARFYGMHGDTLLEFDLRGEDLVFERTHVLGGTDGEPSVNGTVRFYYQYPAPDGCMHGFAQALSEAGRKADSMGVVTQSVPVLLHASSCGEDADTLIQPAETAEVPGYRTVSSPRFTADGRPMVLVTVLKSSGIYTTDGDSREPSWIYLATMNPAGKWDWELIAKY
jgi:hypothetical protein